jgi:hypothetical protein
MNTRSKVIFSVLILVAIFVLWEKNPPGKGPNQNGDTPNGDEGPPKIEKELVSPDEKGKAPQPKGHKLNSDLEKPSEDVVYPAIFPTIDDLLSFGPHFLEESAVPEWKFYLQTLPHSLNSAILDEFQVQPTCMTLFKIAKEITSSNPKESILKDFLLLIEALDDKVEPAGDPTPPILPHISYVRHLGNFIKFHLELLKFTDSLPVSEFIYGRLLKCPLKITNLEFISFLDSLSSPQILDTLLDRFHYVALSSMFLKNNLRELKNSQSTFYSFLRFKAHSLRALIFLYQAKFPEALQSDYSLLVKSGFSHELVIKFVDSFYSQDPLPENDSIFTLLGGFYFRNFKIELAAADERDFSRYHLTKPLSYQEYHRHLGFTQFSHELPKFEKYLESLGKSHPGNLFGMLFPDPNSQISPLEAFDSFFSKFRFYLFRHKKLFSAFLNYIAGFNYHKNDNEFNDLRVLGLLQWKISCVLKQINNYKDVLNNLHRELKEHPEKEDFEYRVQELLVLRFPEMAVSKLVSLWDMIDSLGKPESLSICKDLFESLRQYYALNLEYEQFRVDIMGKEASKQKRYQQIWNNICLPFQDLDWSTKISKLRMQNQQTLPVGENS